MRIVKSGLITCLTLVCFMCVETYANVDSDLHQFFNGIGYMSNTTAPAAYQGQAAGYYTGGSLYLRNQVSNSPLMSIELPSFSGGCSGIDTFMGSFSVINSDQLKQMGKNILSAGGAYAMDLALTTTVPQIKTVKDYIQKFVNDINSVNINSCNTAEDLVGGIWPKTQASQQQICRDLGSHNGAFTDWADARQGCGTGGDFDKGLGDGGARKSEIIVNKNLVWDSLMQNTFTSEDTGRAEILMSLSGTIIVKKGENGKTIRLPLVSLADNNFLKAFLHGNGFIKIYHCDEYTKCLNPTLKTIMIHENAGLVNQVKKMIETLESGVISDTGSLSLQVRGFLEMTPIPILKLLSTESALGLPDDSMQYAEIIAISLLEQYLTEDIKIVRQAMVQEDTPMNVRMMDRIDAAQAEITQSLLESYKKLQNTQLLVTNMRSMEQQLSSRLASRASIGQEK